MKTQQVYHIWAGSCYKNSQRSPNIIGVLQKHTKYLVHTCIFFGGGVQTKSAVLLIHYQRVEYLTYEGMWESSPPRGSRIMVGQFLHISKYVNSVKRAIQQQVGHLLCNGTPQILLLTHTHRLGGNRARRQGIPPFRPTHFVPSPPENP